MSNGLRGFLFALITGISWGTVSPVAKELALLDVDMVSVVFLRAAIVSVVLGFWMLLRTHGSMKISAKQFSLFTLSGLLTVVFTGGGFLMSLKYLSVPVALILHYAFPLVTMVGSIIFLGEKPTWAHFASGLLVVFGLWLGLGGGALSVSVPGILFGIVGVIGLAGQSILGRHISRPSNEKPVDRNVFLFYCLFTGAILMGAIKFFMVGMGDVPQIFDSGKKVLLVLVQAVFGNLVPYWAYFTSLRYISANAASLICTSEIVIGMAVAAVWFGTVPSMGEILGASVIIVAIAISAGFSRNETKKSAQYPHEA